MVLPYGKCKIPYQIQGGLFSAELGPPIPAIGAAGTLTLDWRVNSGSSSLLINKGDEITILTGGVPYKYYATADAGVFDGSNTRRYVSVLPLIQTAHNLADQWYLKAMPQSLRLGYSAISPCLPVGTNAGVVGCLPYLSDWPSAADANGIAYDQANIWALSFYPPNNPFHSTAESDMIPVPKVIGTEYTLFSPRGLGAFYVPFQKTTYEPPDTVHYAAPSYSRFRTATSAWDRGHEASYAARFNWQARQHSYATYSANNNPYSGGSSLTWDAGTGKVSSGLVVLVSGASNLYANGLRGGQFSICGTCYDTASSSYTGFTIDVMLDDSGGAGQVLLKSIVIPSSGSVGPWTVVSGTWAGIVLPTVPGVCKEIYLKCTPGIPGATIVDIFDGSGICASGSTNVPWCHSVATGSKVAPGGLIAPFYEPY